MLWYDKIRYNVNQIFWNMFSRLLKHYVAHHLPGESWHT